MTIMDLVGLPLDTQYRFRMHRIPGGAVAECITELSEAGFYRYTLAEDLEKAKRIPLEDLEDYGYVFSHTSREAITDSEDINEGGVIHFLNDIRHLVPCSEIISSFVREEYQERVDVVEFTNVHCRVWDWSEFVQEPSLAWLLAHDRSVKMMNKMLETYEFEDRLYYYHGGNDNTVILVTPLILQILVRHGAITPNTI